MSFHARGQSLDSTGNSVQKLSDSTSNSFFASQNESLPINTGRLFYPVLRIEGHTFVFSDEWKKGTITYDGVTYQDVTFNYDVYQQELVVVTPKSIPIRVLSERVQRFVIEDQVFTRHNAGKEHGLKTGFYQQPETGKITILIHRRKIVQEKIVQQTLERKFVSEDTYYALKDGKYHVIHNQKSLLNLLADSRQAVTRHLKQQKLKYKHDNEQYILQAAHFYNQLHK